MLCRFYIHKNAEILERSISADWLAQSFPVSVLTLFTTILSGTRLGAVWLPSKALGDLAFTGKKHSVPQPHRPSMFLPFPPIFALTSTQVPDPPMTFCLYAVPGRPPGTLSITWSAHWLFQHPAWSTQRILFGKHSNQSGLQPFASCS